MRDCLTLSARRFGFCPSGSCCARGTAVAVETLPLSSIAASSDCGFRPMGEVDMATNLLSRLLVAGWLKASKLRPSWRRRLRRRRHLHLGFAEDVEAVALMHNGILGSSSNILIPNFGFETCLRCVNSLCVRARCCFRFCFTFFLGVSACILVGLWFLRRLEADCSTQNSANAPAAAIQLLETASDSFDSFR